MKKIGIALLELVILIFNFIIGANEKGLRVLPISILMSLIIIYLIIKKIKEPDKNIFFKSKIDYLVLIFMLTTTLPFIFGTYCSYTNTVEFIIKYFFIYSVYVLARNVITDKKDLNQIITATLICSLIPIILGIDNIKGKYLYWLCEKLDLLYSGSGSFSATFGYANAVAIYMSLCLFLSLYKIKNSENKNEKIITLIYIIFISYVIWITSSKAVIALLVATLLIFFIMDNKKKICENWKKVLLVLLAVIALGTPIIIYAMGVSTSVYIDGDEYEEKIKYSFLPNKEYKLELDIESSVKAKQVKDMAFELQIIQENQYFKDKKIAKKRFGIENGIIDIVFTPEENCSRIRLKITNDFYGKINIRKCYINGEEYILKYKYLPKEIGRIFVEYRLDQKSIKERMYIYSDCLEIAKNNYIIGQGGNTWRVLSPVVHDYMTLLKETHSYFFELLISYGIVGVIAFLTLIVSLFVKTLKKLKNNKEKVLIFLGVFLVLIHSFVFDFSMSFMLIQIIVYIYIAGLLDDEQNNEKIPKALDYILILFLIFILSVYIRTDIAEYIVKDANDKQSIASYSREYCYKKIEAEIENKEDKTQILNDIQELMNKEPYYNQTELQKKYFNLVCDNIGEMSDEDLENYLTFVTEKLKTVKFRTPLFIETILTRTKAIKGAINKLQEYANGLSEDSKTKEIIVNAVKELEWVLDGEYERNISNIESIDKTGYTEKDANSIKKEYLEILNK